MTDTPARPHDTNVPTVAVRRARIVLLGGWLALLVGCSTETRYQWLSTFFDGVPPPGGSITNALPPIVYDEDGRPMQTLPAASLTASAPPQTFTAHPPYEEKQCDSCHVSRYNVALSGSQQEVCFTCHDDFLANMEYKHGPADSGECLSCHNPHGAAEEKLLTSKGRDLCISCHDADAIADTPAHREHADALCWTCHDPHASARPKYLKPGVEGPAP